MKRRSHRILVALIVLIALAFLAVGLTSPAILRCSWGVWAVVLVVLTLLNVTKGPNARRH